MFSHSCHSRGVCILTPKVKGKIELLFQDNCGRKVLITSQINGLKVSLCNLYAPNNSVDHWLRFLQELNCCLIDKADITTLIIYTKKLLNSDWLRKECSSSVTRVQNV